MPWTTPETFTAGQTLTAASMNVISGNLDAVGGAWTSYTPTWTNLTVGNATQSAAYMNAGKLYVVRFALTFGSDTSISGTIEFTLPNAVSVNADYDELAVLGGAVLQDTGTNSHLAYIFPSSSTDARARILRLLVSGTSIVGSGQNSTTPFTWTTNDRIAGQFMFEAA